MPFCMRASLQTGDIGFFPNEAKNEAAKCSTTETLFTLDANNKLYLNGKEVCLGKFANGTVRNQVVARVDRRTPFQPTRFQRTQMLGSDGRLAPAVDEKAQYVITKNMLVRRPLSQMPGLLNPPAIITLAKK